MKTLSRLGILLLCTALVVGCNMPQKSVPVIVLAGMQGPQAWIDAPLDGMQLTLGAPYDIVFHISYQTAVTEGELSINGQVLASLPNPKPGTNLATLHQAWTPASPGEYTIRARALSPTDGWGDYVQAVVEVGQPTPSFTPTRVQTITITPTPTWTATPPPVAAFTVLNKSSDQFFFLTSGCGPVSVTLEVQVSDPRIKDVTLFFHLQDKVTGKKTNWNEGVGMQSEGNGKFTATVQSASIPSHNSFKDSYFLYQFAGTDAANNIVGRSPVYSDIILSACGILIIPHG